MTINEKQFTQEELPFLSSAVSVCAYAESGDTASGLETQLMRPVFYDIETTGLSAARSHVYLIGVLYFDGVLWQLRQWLAGSKEEEPEVLGAFSSLLHELSVLAITGSEAGRYVCIDFNGTTFDRPFLKKRFAACCMADPLEELPFLDLFRLFSPLKKLLSLSSFRQTDLEGCMMRLPRMYPDGRDCIRVLHSYEKSPAEGSLRVLLGHNEEDLSGLLAVTALYPLLELCKGRIGEKHDNSVSTCWKLTDAKSDGISVGFTLTCSRNIPAAIRLDGDEWSLHSLTEPSVLVFTVRLESGQLRQFYPNYKEYDYLPDEDTAVPKAISRFLDRSLKKPSTRDTCYTWFPCTEEFLEQPQEQLTYLRNAFLYYLS
ncbi:MAG: ribonuclease H-like domain-containing protein [Blautia sp.]|nr:ribonuclease H-like domain-containing protein [Blautia sp.]